MLSCPDILTVKIAECKKMCLLSLFSSPITLWSLFSLPLNCARRLACDIKTNAVNAFDFVDDAVGKFLEQLIWQLYPVRGHAVLRIDGADRDSVIVSALVPHYTHTPHWKQDGEALPDLIVPTAILHFLDYDAVGITQDFQSSGRHFTQDANGKSRARKRLAQHDFARQTQLEAQFAHLILEKAFQWFDQLKAHPFWQTSDVVVALNHGRRIAADWHRLDHVGIKRSLRQEFGFTRAFGRSFENFDESAADDFSFPFRFSYASQPGKEKSGGILVLQLDLKMPTENLANHFRLAAAQQTIIHKNAGQLIADRLMKQGRGYTGIDAAAQAQNHFFGTNHRLDVLDRLFNITPHRPVLAAAANVVDKIGKNLASSRRMRHLRMELQTEHF